MDNDNTELAAEIASQVAWSMAFSGQALTTAGIREIELEILHEFDSSPPAS